MWRLELGIYSWGSQTTCLTHSSCEPQALKYKTNLIISFFLPKKIVSLFGLDHTNMA